MIILGNSFSGKSSLVRALASMYINKDDDGNHRTQAVDVFSLHISKEKEFSFSTSSKPESRRVWVLGGNSFYYTLHQNLIKTDTLTLIVINGDHTYSTASSVKYWTWVCQKFGLTNPLIVFTMADKRDHTTELRSTFPDCFYVSSKCDSDDLQRLRSTIVERISQSRETFDQSTENLIKMMKIMTPLDDWNTCQIFRIVKTLFDVQEFVIVDYSTLKRTPTIKAILLSQGIFHPDVFRKLMNSYSTFLLTNITSVPLSSEGKCEKCPGKNLTEIMLGQCTSVYHGYPRCDLEEDRNFVMQDQDSFDKLCDTLMKELIEKRIFYPVKLEDGQTGYFLPRLLHSPRLPEPIHCGIKITYSKPEALTYRLFDEVFDLILEVYPLVWSDNTRLAEANGFEKAQFSVEGVEGLIKLFEFESYVIMELPAPVEVEDLLGPKFKWKLNVEPQLEKTNHTSKRWKQVVSSEW